MKKIIIAIVTILLVGVGVYYFINLSNDSLINSGMNSTVDVVDNTATSTVQNPNNVNKKETMIGTSAGGLPIMAYHYGNGDSEILFVGGIHGGYEWNTVLLAYDAMKYLDSNLSIMGTSTKVTIIPVLNPDGLNKVVGTTSPFTVANVPKLESETIPGRFNKNGVDLNRNFDCDWQTAGVWQDKKVNGGTSVFSEPESQAIKNYIESANIKSVIVWYSAVGGVFSSNCHNGVLPETKILTNIYADASGYKAYEDFNFYEITGDMVNWLAKKNIPAISVLLTNHTDVEWSKNKAGINAILNYYK